MKFWWSCKKNDKIENQNNNIHTLNTQVVPTELIPIDVTWGETLSVNESLGQKGYKILRPLAKQGGQSETFLISDIKSNELFVAKVIEYQYESQCLEIELLKKLKHPHVVKLIDSWTTDHAIVIIMECCSAGDLSSYLKSYSQPSSKWVIRWMSQISLGLHFVHLHNVIHFDLKTSNIFLDKDLCVKLGDFGVSRLSNRSESNQSTEIRGTLHYLSPEMLSRRAKLTWASDCWALGCLLHELMYDGHPAFPLPAKYCDKANASNSLYGTLIGNSK